MDRNQNTKKRAQRIDLNYFKRTYPIPHWRRVLSIALTVVGLVWLGYALLAGSERPYSAGPVSHAHAMVKCQSCHLEAAPVWGTKVTDQSCEKCHQGPKHHANTVNAGKNVGCQDCHVEHKGSMHLAATSENACTQCHSSLQSSTGKFDYVTAGADGGMNIKSFAEGDGHPEFAILRKKTKDPGTIKFNHAVHLQREMVDGSGKKIEKFMLDIHGKRVHLECSDCHRPAGLTAPWPYADASLIQTLLPGQHVENKPMGDYMAPVNFEEHCSNCHSLVFSDDIPKAEHRVQPSVLKPWIEKQLTDYIKAHPDVLAHDMKFGIGPSNAEREFDKIFGVGGDPRVVHRLDRAPPRSQADWILQKMDDSELLLWRKTCKQCHTLTYMETGGREVEDCPPSAKVPCVVKTNITERWFSHSSFQHQAHQMVKCQQCHVEAEKSKATADVLLPGVKVCQDCHKPGADAAEARCYECHAYHDWNKQKPVNGTYTIKQLQP